MSKTPRLSRLRERAKLLAWVAIVATPLAGCVTDSVDRTVPTAAVSEDYHLRHPVVLANAPQLLDIYFIGANGRMDTPQNRQLEAFARDYLGSGQGGIQIAMPAGPVDQRAAELTLGAVRRALLNYGVRDRVVLTTYPVADPSLASPLRLSFLKLQVRPTTHCGDWPADLGSGASMTGWKNTSYYNLGCASQQTLTAQIADPRDLVKPRAEDPTDVQLRTRAIGRLRGQPDALPGQDPSTNWREINQPNLIGTVGGF